MMKKHTTHLLAFVLFIGILFFSCCKEDDCDDPTNRLCPNFDVCLVTPQADASFVMLDSVNPNWADTSIGFFIDTVLEGSTIHFKALRRNMNSYEWKIGTDATVFTEKEFDLGFHQFSGHIDVRLITAAKDEYGCLSIDQLTDTSYQTFEVLDIWPYDKPIYGEYLGSNLISPNEQYTITVLGEGENLWHSPRLFGLAVPCEYPIGLRFFAGYDWFISVHEDLHCRNTIVIGRLQEDNKTLEVEYFYDTDDGKRIQEVFVGTRI